MELALEARCLYALYKVTGRKYAKDLEKALRLARSCGEMAYPEITVSKLLLDEPELLKAYHMGWMSEADNYPQNTLEPIVPNLVGDEPKVVEAYHMGWMSEADNYQQNTLEPIVPNFVSDETKVVEACHLGGKSEADNYQQNTLEPIVPNLVSDETKVVEAYPSGGRSKKDKDRPLTTEELNTQVQELVQEANHGCGSYYELFAEKLNDLGSDWLADLHPDNVAEATKLLEAEGFESDPEGSWSYDHEEGDIVYTPFNKS